MPPPGPISRSGTDQAIANSLMSRDANANTAVNNLNRGITITTLTGAGGITTTLTIASSHTQAFIGTPSGSSNCKLPVVSTLVLGFEFLIINLTGQILGVNSSGNNVVFNLQPGESVLVKCILITGTSAASWAVILDGPTYEAATATANTMDTASSAIDQAFAALYTDSQIALFSPKGLFDNITPVASASTNGTEDDLFSNTITLLTVDPGLKIVQSEVVTVVGSATATRRIRKYIDSTLIFDSGSLTLSLGGTFIIQTFIIVTSAGKVTVSVSVVTTSASTVPYATFTAEFSSDPSLGLTLKTTGTAGGVGAASGDIVDRFGTISFVPPGASVI